MSLMEKIRGRREELTPESPPEHEKVREGLAAFTRACEDRDLARHRAEQFERAYTTTTSENDMLREQLARTQSQLGFYMRHVTELRTQLESACDLIHAALEKSRVGAHRSEGNAPVAALVNNEPQVEEPRVPEFLTQPRSGADADNTYDPREGLESALREMSNDGRLDGVARQ